MRKIFFALLFLSVSFTSFAKDSTDVFVSVHCGPQYFTGKSDYRLGFSKMISPVAGVSYGRYLNKWLVLDGTLGAARFKGVYIRPAEGKHFSTNEVFELNDKAYYQKGTYLDFYVRAGMNLNRFNSVCDCHYKPAYFVPYVGLGVASGVGHSLGGSNFGLAPTLDYGIMFLYDFPSSLSFLFDFHGRGIGKQLEGESCDEHILHASFGIELGVVYKFRK